MLPLGAPERLVSPSQARRAQHKIHNNDTVSQLQHISSIARHHMQTPDLSVTIAKSFHILRLYGSRFSNRANLLKYTGIWLFMKHYESCDIFFLVC